jgi:hypothetical protein
MKPKNISSFAYPNYESALNIPGQHNLQKWMQAVKDIYYSENQGMDRPNAIRKIVAGWSVVEAYDFLNWLKYYEEGTHMKYKAANLWYENGEPGYFLHIKNDPVKSETLVSNKEINEAKDPEPEELSKSEKKNIIEKQRKKIIGRFDSVEKLLRSEEGQLFADKELESLIEAIYSLKKKVQLVNKVSTSNRTYQDLIVRQANILNRDGFSKASDFLHKLAEEIPQEKQQEKPSDNAVPEPLPVDAPTQPTGSPGGLPSTGPGMPQTPPESAPNNTINPSKIKSPAVIQLLENLDGSNITTDNTDANDELEVSDHNLGDDLLVTEAQVVPPNPPAPPPAPVAQKPSIEDKPTNDKPKPTKNFDNIIDTALSNITIADVVDKLEDLAKVFKTREIPRQLAIVDLMLDHLGLASFFPTLSEATNKSLESNNYISTRIEEILSKLRGSIETHEIDLHGENAEPNPEVEKVKNVLQNQEDKEKARKKMRKELENQQLDESTGKETPDIEVEEDLAPPPAPTQKVAPPAPAPPPPAPIR